MSNVTDSLSQVWVIVIILYISQRLHFDRLPNMLVDVKRAYIYK